MRIAGWETALVAALQVHAHRPLLYGVSDCFTLPMDCVRAITGDDPWADQRDYDSLIGAARLLLQQGFRSVGDAFAAKCPEIPPALAGRGDLAVVAEGDSVAGCVVIGALVAGKSKQYGLCLVPRARMLRAFKVG